MSAAASFHWSQAVPWALVVVGWALVNIQNNSREERKEVKSRVDFIKKLIDEVEADAIVHHTSDQDHLRCLRIKRSLTRLAKELGLLHLLGVDCSDSQNVRLTQFRQAVTLENFETRQYKALNPADPIVSMVGVTADGLRHEIESAFVSRYPVGRWRLSRLWRWNNASSSV